MTDLEPKFANRGAAVCEACGKPIEAPKDPTLAALNEIAETLQFIASMIYEEVTPPGSEDEGAQDHLPVDLNG